jgi:plasmid stability protein
MHSLPANDDGIDVRALTVRNLPPDLAAALDEERRRRGTSLNQTVIDLLSQALGVGGPRSNGLAELAGHWSTEAFEAFERAMEGFSGIDPEMWSSRGEG